MNIRSRPRPKSRGGGEELNRNVVNISHASEEVAAGATDGTGL